MKRWLLALLLPAAAMAADRYELDPTHTYPEFSVSHMGLSLMHGRFNETAGSFVLDRKGEGSSVQVTVKVASLDSGMPARDERLRADNFLDAAHFPEMSYRSTRVIFSGDKITRIEGQLTLHGVTRPLALEVTAMNCAIHAIKRVWACGFEAQGMLKRSDYGITTYLPEVGDEVIIRVEAEGAREEKSVGVRH
ncbi:MAG TPA: YceI family protein [Nevskiaceae bacterium]|nr:YceI family protein [Nevskiaceae bacterium]